MLCKPFRAEMPTRQNAYKADDAIFANGYPMVMHYTVLKPVPGSGSRANCAQFHGSSDAKHVSSWFQPWATLWPTCHMLVPASFLLNV